MRLPKGRYVSIDENYPQGLGMCDRSRFMFMHKDLVKQMEWRGNALVWTGLLVGKPFLNTPNEQFRPPILPPDPVPLENPRIPQGNLPYILGVPALPEKQRVNKLKAFNWYSPIPVPPGNNNSSDGIPALPTDVRLKLLEEFHWSA